MNEVEHRLLAHPTFGNSELIRARLQGYLASIAGTVASPRASFQFGPLLQDPVFRNTMRLMAAGDAEGVKASLRTPMGLDVEGLLASEREDVARVCCGDHSCLLLQPGPGSAHRRFQELFDAFAHADFPGAGLRLVTAVSDEVERLARAVELLVFLFPRLGPDTLRHVGVIALVDSGGAFHSTTLADLPGAVFLDRRGLSDIPLTVELLFHEALHAKLDAVAETTPLLQAGDETAAPRVTVVWHRSTAAGMNNQWPIFRALAAFHVYAHLVFLADALAGAEAHRQHSERLRPRALFRAHYLGRELLRSAGDVLTEGGRGLVEWLLTMLPTPHGFSPAERYLIETGAQGLVGTTTRTATGGR